MTCVCVCCYRPSHEKAAVPFLAVQGISGTEFCMVRASYCTYRRGLVPSARREWLSGHTMLAPRITRHLMSSGMGRNAVLRRFRRREAFIEIAPRASLIDEATIQEGLFHLLFKKPCAKKLSACCGASCLHPRKKKGFNSVLASHFDRRLN